MSGTVEAKDGVFKVKLPAKSMTFLTTDYEDVVPAAVEGVEIRGGKLFWAPASDANHRYYRVYRDGRQIASTVATSLPLADAKGRYEVKSVDKWNNLGK